MIAFSRYVLRPDIKSEKTGLPIFSASSSISQRRFNIFPEFERRGFATQVLNFFKEDAREIIADRVRGTARVFWEKMDFTDMGNGDYRWVSNGRHGN